MELFYYFKYVFEKKNDILNIINEVKKKNIVVSNTFHFNQINLLKYRIMLNMKIK